MPSAEEIEMAKAKLIFYSESAFLKDWLELKERAEFGLISTILKHPEISNKEIMMHQASYKQSDGKIIGYSSEAISFYDDVLEEMENDGLVNVCIVGHSSATGIFPNASNTYKINKSVLSNGGH